MKDAKRARRRATAKVATPKTKQSPLEVLLAELLREPQTSAGHALDILDHFTSAADQHERAAQAHRAAGVAAIVAAALSTLHRASDRAKVKP